MNFPLSWIPSENYKKIFFPLLTLTIILLVILQFLNQPLVNPVSPSGMVSFELAGTAENAQAIIASWDANAQLVAAFGLGLDYLFLIIYGLTISLGVLMASGKQRGKFEVAGIFISWGILVASLLDAIENYALWRILVGVTAEIYPRVAAYSAKVKFFLIFVGIGFALISWLWPKRIK